MSRDRERMEKSLRKILAEDFGIMNNYELGRAIYEMERANLAVMLVPFGKENDETRQENHSNGSNSNSRTGSRKRGNSRKVAEQSAGGYIFHDNNNSRDSAANSKASNTDAYAGAV